MSTYVLGDLQGCHDALLEMLERVRFSPDRDRLWLVGDLVNRGPQSVKVLRHVAGLGSAAVTVLGNHDIHLLMVAAGMTPLKRIDTFGDVLDAPDRDELLGWLRRQPLLHVEGGWAMAHAGVLPDWDRGEAAQAAAEAERLLAGPAWRAFFAELYGNEPVRWADAHSPHARGRFAINAFTRMRLVDDSGALEFSHKGALGAHPGGFVPWFESPRRRVWEETVVFGHWSALGLVQRPGVVGLDTGCVWGRQLTALRLEDGALFSIDCPRLSMLEPD